MGKNSTAVNNIMYAQNRSFTIITKFEKMSALEID